MVSEWKMIPVCDGQYDTETGYSNLSSAAARRKPEVPQSNILILSLYILSKDVLQYSSPDNVEVLLHVVCAWTG